MNTIVVYKTKYGSTEVYAKWIAEELGCEAKDAKDVKINDLMNYDTIIYGGGLYAEIINGVTLITKNLDKLKGKKLIVFTTGITPLDCRAYYEGEVYEKNFKDPKMLDEIKVFNFLGKMVVSELSFVHRKALVALKKIMQKKENPTELEKLLIELCDADGDFTNREDIKEIIEYAQN